MWTTRARKDVTQADVPPVHVAVPVPKAKSGGGLGATMPHRAMCGQEYKSRREYGGGAGQVCGLVVTKEKTDTWGGRMNWVAGLGLASKLHPLASGWVTAICTACYGDV